MKQFLTIAAIGGLALGAGAQSFQQAQANAAQAVDEARAEYAQVMKEIGDEKIPLNKEAESLFAQVIQARQEYAQQRRLVEGADNSLLILKSQVDGLSDNVNYITNLLADYVQRFDTMITLGEKPKYQKEIAEAQQARDNNELTPGARYEEQLDVVDAALNRLEGVIGGYKFEGTALTEARVQVPGTYIILGPQGYFAPSNDAAAGITLSNVNSTQPQIGSRLPGANPSQAISAFAASGEGTVPVGPLQAYVVETGRDTLVQEFKKGGPVMWPILGLTVLALLVALYKLFELMGVKAARQRDLDVILEHLANGRQDEAMAHAKGLGGPVGDMLQAAVENAYEDREVLEEVLYEKIISTQPKLDRMLPIIAVVAATGPLLGLLGTVTGMIKTFKLITIVGTGDARSLSSGISEALITTKWGLISAIPSLIFHALLSRKARGVIGSMEQTAVGFINGMTEIRDSTAQSA